MNLVLGEKLVVLRSLELMRYKVTADLMTCCLTERLGYSSKPSRLVRYSPFTSILSSRVWFSSMQCTEIRLSISQRASEVSASSLP